MASNRHNMLLLAILALLKFAGRVHTHHMVRVWLHLYICTPSVRTGEQCCMQASLRGKYTHREGVPCWEWGRLGANQQVAASQQAS